MSHATQSFGVDPKKGAVSLAAGLGDEVVDKTGRFVALPSISDGQLLFAQHVVYQLDKDGIAVVVHNGSSLFSGDAGSGESEIRKHFFDSININCRIVH